jgi:tRNA threonylcarbamoyladenosine biosynthesis protein TsaE
MKRREEKLVSHSVEETWEIARKVVERASAGTVIALHGELGSGKTCFVKGLALALGIDQLVTSPTFTLVREYNGRRRLYHIDLYRLHSPDEALALGFEEYLQTDGITAIEWAERAGDLIPQDAIKIWFEALVVPEQRAITIVYTV